MSLNRLISIAFLSTVFSVSGHAATTVSSYSLIDNATKTVFGVLSSGSVIDLGSLPTQNISVQAKLNSSAGVSKVVFDLDNLASHSENGSPYSVCGDYVPCAGNTLLAGGAHTLVTTAYDSAGVVLVKDTINFAVQGKSPAPLSVISYMLVDNSSKAVIATLIPGSVLTLSSLPTQDVSIRANLSANNSLSKVVFDLNAQAPHTENSGPYFACGDYIACPFETGTNTLTTTAYDSAGAVLMTSTMSFTVQTLAPATGPQHVSAYRAFGDSITIGHIASSPALGYVRLLGVDTAATTVTNRGASGHLACDASNFQVFAKETPQATDGTIYTVMIGTNDANTKGVGAYESNFNSCYQAALSWLAVPAPSKVTAQSTGCIKTGVWLKNSTLPLAGLYSQTNGDTMTCQISTNGAPLYIWYWMDDGNGGLFSYSVDGNSPIIVHNYPETPIATQNGYTQGEAVIRVTGLMPGTHSVRFVVTSQSAPSNQALIFGIGTPSDSAPLDIPHLFVTGVPRQGEDAKSSITAQYEADARANVELLQKDGLRIYFVDERSYWHGNASEMGDHLHPNDLGHSELRDAFDAVIKAFYVVQ